MSKMIELHDIDVPGFLSVLDSCEGNVYLMTSDGDKLNLKSKLCQLIGLTSLIEGGKIASIGQTADILPQLLGKTADSYSCLKCR